MSNYYGYIRVSTVKQGTQGVSLQEQKDAILRYAKRSGIEITAWFEEQVTAAKQGRPIFTKMMTLLRQGKAQGVVLHKIDRGARNLKDWASIADLNDQGIDVHLANDGLDMKSRGGRLSADIQAVIASDYIRNLREETLKGFYGRLKQGILPIAAPVGYANNGGGKVKTAHPIMAPLVVKAFELYATGKYSFNTLPPVLEKMGLRNMRGNPVPRSALTNILNNPFYMGLIKIRKTGETFKGAHTTLISKNLFDQVQAVISGKSNSKIQKHDFLYRRVLRCKLCTRALIGEKHKGHVYYRCQQKDCPMTCIREELVHIGILEKLALVSMSPKAVAYITGKIQQMKAGAEQQEAAMRAGLQLKLGQLRERLNRLTDALIDGAVDRESFNHRKDAFLRDQKQTEEDLEQLTARIRDMPDQVADSLELLKNVHLHYAVGIQPEKRRILYLLTSNLSAVGKESEFAMRSPYADIAKLREKLTSAHQRDEPRMLDLIISTLQDHLKKGSVDLLHVDSSIPSQEMPRHRPDTAD